MKKLLLTASAILAAVLLNAQAPKMLSLEESSVKALETGLIDQDQKRQVDSLIVLYYAERADINKVRKSLTAEELQARTKKMSGNFTNGLKKLIGNDGYARWNAMRKGIDQ